MGRTILFLGLVLVLISEAYYYWEKSMALKIHLTFDLEEKIGRFTSRLALPYWSVLF